MEKAKSVAKVIQGIAYLGASLYIGIFVNIVLGFVIWVAMLFVAEKAMKYKLRKGLSTISIETFLICSFLTAITLLAGFAGN